MDLTKRRHNRLNKTNKIKRINRKKTRKFNKKTHLRKNNLKIKKKKYVLKGGGINFIDLSGFETQQTDGLLPANTYDAIYIAIGAKHHKIKVPGRQNLGEYELFPYFFMNECYNGGNPLSNALIIIIDEFIRTGETVITSELDENKDIINNAYNELIEDFKNTEYTFVFINSLFNDSFISPMVNYLKNKKQETNVWICNYVYFFNPSPRDERIYEYINGLLTILSKELKDNEVVNYEIYKWSDFVNRNYVLNINCNETSINFIMTKPKLAQLKESDTYNFINTNEKLFRNDKEKTILKNCLLNISYNDPYNLFT